MRPLSASRSTSIQTGDGACAVSGLDGCGSGSAQRPHYQPAQARRTGPDSIERTTHRGIVFKVDVARALGPAVSTLVWTPSKGDYVQGLSETQKTGCQYRNPHGTVWHVHRPAVSTRLRHHHRQ